MTYSTDKINNMIYITLDMWDRNVSILNTTDYDPICQELRKRLTNSCFQLSAIIPEHLLYYCSLCAQGNLWYAIVLLKDILTRNRDTIRENVPMRKILGSSVVRGSINGSIYPLISDGRSLRKYQRLWEEQKQGDCNFSDSRNYWVNGIL